MKRFPMFLDWLNHSHQPPEAQSPFKASVAAALISFILICWIDGGVISLRQAWWTQLLAYAFIPILLAFIILYRSSWHREMGSVTRSLATALMSCLIFAGALMAFGATVVLISLAYVSSFDHFTRFHY